MLKSLNDITPADLDEITKFAAAFFTPKQIAIVLQVDSEKFIDECDKEDCDIYLAFHAGRLKSEFEIKQAIVKLAKSGSSPAQTMSMEMLRQSQQKMMEK